MTIDENFDTYTIFNTKTVELGYDNITEWELLASNDAVNWSSFFIGSQSARYVMLRIYKPDDSQAGTIRLYEFILS